MSPAKTAFALLTLSVFAGCSVPSATTDEGPVESDGAAVSVVKTGYVSVRRDTRRCAYPMCGGYLLAPVETTKLRCADGTSASECYVPALDFAAMKLTATQAEELRNGAASAILYGQTAKRSYAGKPLGTFLVQKAWLAPNGGKTHGALYFVSANPSKTGRPHQAVRLNWSARRTFDAIDFGAAPGSDEQWDAATAAAKSDVGVILGGAITGPTTSKLFEADQFYLRFPTKAASCADTLAAKVSSLSDGLTWPSESDYPIDFVKADGAVSVEVARTLAGADATAVVEERDFDEWFARVVTVYDPEDPIAVANAERFRALKETLAGNLTNLRVYRFGTINIRVVVIGTTSCGGVAGIATTVIET